jgi:hypothetical protein
MMARPIFFPIPFLRAVCSMTFSLVGKTDPARSRAILYFGHSVIVADCRQGNREHLGSSCPNDTRTAVAAEDSHERNY